MESQRSPVSVVVGGRARPMAGALDRVIDDTEMVFMGCVKRDGSDHDTLYLREYLSEVNSPNTRDLRCAHVVYAIKALNVGETNEKAQKYKESGLVMRAVHEFSARYRDTPYFFIVMDKQPSLYDAVTRSVVLSLNFQADLCVRVMSMEYISGFDMQMSEDLLRIVEVQLGKAWFPSMFAQSPLTHATSVDLNTGDARELKQQIDLLVCPANKLYVLGSMIYKDLGESLGSFYEGMGIGSADTARIKEDQLNDLLYAPDPAEFSTHLGVERIGVFLHVFFMGYFASIVITDRICADLKSSYGVNISANDLVHKYTDLTYYRIFKLIMYFILSNADFNDVDFNKVRKNFNVNIENKNKKFHGMIAKALSTKIENTRRLLINMNYIKDGPFGILIKTRVDEIFERELHDIILQATEVVNRATHETEFNQMTDLARHLEIRVDLVHDIDQAFADRFRVQREQQLRDDQSLLVAQMQAKRQVESALLKLTTEQSAISPSDELKSLIEQRAELSQMHDTWRDLKNRERALNSFLNDHNLNRMNKEITRLSKQKNPPINKITTLKKQRQLLQETPQSAQLLATLSQSEVELARVQQTLKQTPQVGAKIDQVSARIRQLESTAGATERYQVGITNRNERVRNYRDRQTEIDAIINQIHHRAHAVERLTAQIRRAQHELNTAVIEPVVILKTFKEIYSKLEDVHGIHDIEHELAPISEDPTELYGPSPPRSPVFDINYRTPDTSPDRRAPTFASPFMQPEYGIEI